MKNKQRVTGGVVGGGRGRNRGREGESQAGFALSAQSLTRGSNSHETMT